MSDVITAMTPQAFREYIFLLMPVGRKEFLIFVLISVVQPGIWEGFWIFIVHKMNNLIA